MTLTDRQRDAIMDFWDILIPGADDWPSASVAITNFDRAFAKLSEADRGWLAMCAVNLANHAEEHQETAMRALEREEPESFKRVLSMLYGAYYTTPAVHEAVRKLAETGPREPSPYFDMTLLRQMIETQAGKRRM